MGVPVIQIEPSRVYRNVEVTARLGDGGVDVVAESRRSVRHFPSLPWTMFAITARGM